MQIKKPMLACNYDPAKAKFPYILTPKVDGIRFLMVDGVVLSRSFKPIRNKHIQKTLPLYLLDGIDGELTCGNTFQSSTSGIMSIEGTPDFKCWVFDYVDPSLNTILPFNKRVSDPILKEISPSLNHEVLTGVVVHNPEELAKYEEFYLDQGFEGVMLRDPKGTYKFGRATVNENTLLKVKRFVDEEGIIVGYEELMSNENEAQKDAFGRTKRSSHQAGRVPAGTLGALIIQTPTVKTKVGTGFTFKLRNEIWANRDKYLGAVVKFKYLNHGVKDLPRHGVFLGFRDQDDM